MKDDEEEEEEEKKTWTSQIAVEVAATPHKAAALMSSVWGRRLGLKNLNKPASPAIFLIENPKT